MGSKEMQRAPAALLAAILCGGPVTAAASPAPAADTSAPPAIIALALDTSGSIGPDDLERTRDLALSLLSELPQGSQVAVLTFDDQSRVVVPRTSRSQVVRDALAEVKSSGHYTALYDALYDASRYLRDAPPARKAIVLVTDGKDENSALNLDDGLQVAKEGGIPVFAVGVGRVEERVLRRIAKLTRGEYAPIVAASGKDLAGRILVLAPPSPAPAAPPISVPPPAPKAPLEVVPSKASSSGRGALWLLLIGGALVTLALLLAAVSRSGRAPAPSLASATEQAPPETPRPLEAAPVEDDAYSPTVIAKLGSTEEYLEKTLTLSEKPALTIQGGPRNGQLYILSKQSTTSIGRARANDIVLEDVAVSSQHCRIRFDGKGFVVHDLKSTNGTYVNDQRITFHVLRTGDVVKVGETALQFKLDQRKA